MTSFGSSQNVLSVPDLFDSHYLVATKRRAESLCYSPEGWGPISPIRYDFTPCFLDVWLLTVSVFGVVFGAGALWYLLRRCTPQQVDKNWHFFAKLV